MVILNKIRCARLVAIALASISLNAISYGAMRRAVTKAHPALRTVGRLITHTPIKPMGKNPSYDNVLKLRKLGSLAALGTVTGVAFTAGARYMEKGLENNPSVASTRFGDSQLFPSMLFGGAPGLMSYTGALLLSNSNFSHNVKKA